MNTGIEPGTNNNTIPVINCFIQTSNADLMPGKCLQSFQLVRSFTGFWTWRTNIQ